MGLFGVTFKGTGASVPSACVSNNQLTQLVETSDEWIYTRTGFKNRHVLQGDETVIDLAVESAQKALAFAGMTALDLDMIILACSTSEYIYPGPSAMVQHRLGATRAFGLDTNMGCAGLVNAMSVATQFIENGTVKNVLVIAADAHSRFLDWTDRNTCVLFGDGAGAFIMSRQDETKPNDVLGMDFFLDGGRGEQIKLPVQRNNCPLVPAATVPKENSAVYMNGREVFKFAVGEVPRFLEETLKKAQLTFQDVDHFVFHQANERILTAMVERMAVPAEKVVVSLAEYSNTSCASIPLAFNDALAAKQIKQGAIIAFCAFGAGLMINTMIVRWNAVDKRLESGAHA